MVIVIFAAICSCVKLLMVAVIQPCLLWDRILSSGDDSEGIEPGWGFGRGRGQKMKRLTIKQGLERRAEVPVGARCIKFTK